ncbi:lycopene beta-cyclase CrtY [Sphingomonas panacisoli]|uniref:Lycopene beta-cyclase CrtY n=1 Tax=Sphingomonas panacisoli TaxID=1813879 RepID=A0A5B8LL35_9SPHN|nr:lycopene beta-cyclase CrtY [Sphingomonas panacisoli]QDZ08928.1 lycopene beta-cyclase CrtY [Sphingomonas panacisoli]
MPAIIQCDVAIVGGGLAGGLIALALKTKRPDVDIRLIEPGAIGGEHVWSFFSSDVVEADRWLAASLVSYRWPGYDVAFPAHRRTLGESYYSIESERFADVVAAALAPGQLIVEKAIGVGPGAVVLASGDRVEAGGVIDARGAADMAMLDLGWQKFVGRELVLAAPHGIERPMVMDATVEQIDGYRFVYCLPFAETRMFVEDTYYSDTPDIDRAALTKRIDAYAAKRGWRVESVAREEVGALPVAIGGDFDAFWRGNGVNVAKAGLRAGLFHPTTGYSLPDAIRLAAAIASATDLSSEALHDLTHGTAKRAWDQRGFYRMLDAMLFRAAEPEERYRILERFYRLNPALIGRFYAGRSTMTDKARILMGKPPVPVGRALAAIRGTR